MLYPILTQSRLLSDLSGVWDFKLDNGKGFDEKWYERPLEYADTMPVPASYNDLKEGADFRDHYGWVFYQRNVSIPSYVKCQRIVLRCAAVTHYAKIYLNGKLIGTSEAQWGYRNDMMYLNAQYRERFSFFDSRVNYKFLAVSTLDVLENSRWLMNKYNIK